MPFLLEAESDRLLLATTTSTENSGLLSVLLPPFEKQSGIKVDVIAVGTGRALKMGENGDVDMVMVHAREAEDEFVSKGFGVYRKDLMYNDFVILGPPHDPALLKEAASSADAFEKIAGAQAVFISRGDNSGTHMKERRIWEEAEIEPDGKWYKEAGQGMGAVITMAEEMRAYTLSDRGTYLFRKADLSLVTLFEGDPALFNPYGVIAVNPERHPHTNFKAAKMLIDWLLTDEAQNIISSYTVGGRPLFYTHP
jgi:tungstate transport system substrate-binding protein